MNSSKAIAARGGGTVVLKEVLFPRRKNITIRALV
jgi:hypothetical protein